MNAITTQVTHRYTCPNGHSFDAGSWITLLVHWDQPERKREFNYCMECFGEWAEKKWPLTYEETAPFRE